MKKLLSILVLGLLLSSNFVFSENYKTGQEIEGQIVFSKKMYELAANLTLIVHFAFILFVVFGALLFFVATKIIFIHIPAFIWGSYIELTHSICPLTYLENWFLHKANLTTYSEGFIQNYLVPIVYPMNLTKDLQICLGIVLIVVNMIIYGFIISKLKKKF